MSAETFPVVEIFGPTIQGEGALAGLPTHFVRFGLCDYRCSWCDSKHAVEPELVRQAPRMEAWTIARAVRALGRGVGWVTFSGGNPAMHDLERLVEDLGTDDYSIAVETQGSIWRDWLGMADHLVVSPKPPSSGMVSVGHAERTRLFMEKAQGALAPEEISLKIVVFDPADLDWAADLARAYPDWPLFLSVGTDAIEAWGSEVRIARKHREVLGQVADRYRWLCDAVAGDPTFSRARVLPQLHVIAYSHARGV